MFSVSCPMDRHLKSSVSLFWIANACWGGLREFATAHASYNGLGEFLCSALDYSWLWEIPDIVYLMPVEFAACAW